MNTALHYGLRGLGAPCSAGAAAIHSAVGTGLRTAAGLDPEPISKAVLGIASLVQNFFGQPDCDKIATTEIVNQAELFLKQNLAAWQSLPAAQKTVANQQVALQVFDNIWAQVMQSCAGTQQYGSAGIACVADRQQGACHWQANGQCWNWFVGYRDPIANDPQVQQNLAMNPLGSILPGSVTSLLPAGIDPTLLLVGGAAVLLLLVLS
jgi:hypothetical protein